MHDVRNPLDALGNLIYLAEAALGEAPTVGTYLAQAKEQIATIHQIAAQTLGFVQQAPARREVDLVALAEAALRIHHRRLESQQIRPLRDFAEETTARVRPGEILQVLVNLLANSLDALPDGGTILVRPRKRNGSVHMHIADSGHGISDGNLRRLFEPFFTTKGDRGTGLGLALPKKIIEGHNGRIAVRSSIAPSRKGTTLRIRLPA